MTSSVDPRSLRDWLRDGEEIALIDVRNLGAFTRGHLWLAVNLPLGQLELRIGRFVPRTGTRIVLCDEGEGLAERAAELLERRGYNQVHCLEGGVGAWSEAGFELVDGNYVVAHAFGYFLRDCFRIPEIEASALEARVGAGEDFVILDARPEEDHRSGTIPGSISTPAAEILRRIGDIAPDPKTPVVVHCAGITRGVLGAQSLIQGGIGNPVYSLRNGTRGWLAAGLELQVGASEALPPPSPEALSFARMAGRRIAQVLGLRVLDPEQLAQWSRESDRRTLYLVDVRTQEEYLEGHVPGALWVPGGELAGMTIDHFATRNARVCLVADDSGRAEATAGWMLQLGWPEVALLTDWQALPNLETGPEPAAELGDLAVPRMSVSDLAQALKEGGVTLLDVGASGDYRDGHIAGAHWVLRSDLPEVLGRLPPGGHYCLTCPDGRMASFAALELEQMTGLPVAALEGGTQDYRAAGLPLESGMDRALSEVDDLDFVTTAPPAATPEAFIEFQSRVFAWRDGLVQRREHDGTCQFLTLP